jgi:hypothetical protein
LIDLALEDRLAAAPSLNGFLNWKSSNDDQDDGDAEEIQEAADAAASFPKDLEL